MQMLGLIYVAILFGFSLFLVVGCSILQKDREQHRVWKHPEIVKLGNIKDSGSTSKE